RRVNPVARQLFHQLRRGTVRVFRKLVDLSIAAGGLQAAEMLIKTDEQDNTKGAQNQDPEPPKIPELTKYPESQVKRGDDGEKMQNCRRCDGRIDRAKCRKNLDPKPDRRQRHDPRGYSPRPIPPPKPDQAEGN